MGLISVSIPLEEPSFNTYLSVILNVYAFCRLLDTADLVYLDLSNNQLTEFTSESFSRNTKLDTLDVSYNYISTIYPVAHLEVRGLFPLLLISRRIHAVIVSCLAIVLSSLKHLNNAVFYLVVSEKAEDQG